MNGFVVLPINGIFFAASDSCEPLGASCPATALLYAHNIWF